MCEKTRESTVRCFWTAVHCFQIFLRQFFSRKVSESLIMKYKSYSVTLSSRRKEYFITHPFEKTSFFFFFVNYISPTLVVMTRRIWKIVNTMIEIDSLEIVYHHLRMTKIAIDMLRLIQHSLSVRDFLSLQ